MLCLVRPETVTIVPVNGVPVDGAVAGEVVANTFIGSTSRVRVAVKSGERTLIADISTSHASMLTVGTAVVASFPSGSPRLLSLADQSELFVPSNP